MTQILGPGKFEYGNRIECNVLNNTVNFSHIVGHVVGKVIDSDLYLVLLHRGVLKNGGFEYNAVIKTFGVPNRHLPLSWGKYYGYWNEFIIPEKYLGLL